MLIWGNHEPYGSVWKELMADERRQLADLQRQGLDIRVLRGDVTEIMGVRIVGATLWTDLKLYPRLKYMARMEVEGSLLDYRKIKTTPLNPFTTSDMLKLHGEDKTALFQALKQHHEGPTVVMTHHLPIRELIAPWRVAESDRDNLIHCGFASDLWNEIKTYKVHTWICGHSHDNRRWTGHGDHGPTRFVMNPRGYPSEPTNFDPEFMITVH